MSIEINLEHGIFRKKKKLIHKFVKKKKLYRRARWFQFPRRSLPLIFQYNLWRFDKFGSWNMLMNALQNVDCRLVNCQLNFIHNLFMIYSAAKDPRRRWLLWMNCNSIWTSSINWRIPSSAMSREPRSKNKFIGMNISNVFHLNEYLMQWPNQMLNFLFRIRCIINFIWYQIEIRATTAYRTI